MSRYYLDQQRYNAKMPKFQKYFRKVQEEKNIVKKVIYRFNFKIYKKKNHIELDVRTNIGGGIYFGHPYCITINKNVIIGKNCNIHKGVTIGQENRGSRKGTPIIGDDVWIGINTTIVGKIKIGNDVLIAPNSFVNVDVPDHSIVIGNPCIIKHKIDATKDYINRRI